MSPRQVTWRRLRPGLITAGVIVVGALAILAFARVGELHGKTYRLYVVADEANGIFDGSEVWLAGRKVGEVRGIAFLPPRHDSAARLLVALDVLERYQPYIRRDARAEFRSGGQLLRAQVVYLYVGTDRAPETRAGDTLAQAEQVDPDGIATALSRAGNDLPQILENLHEIGSAFSKSADRVDALEGHHVTGISLLLDRADSLARRAATAHGTLGHLSRDRGLGERIDRAERAVDSLLGILESHHGTVRQVRVSDALARRLRDARATLAGMRSALASERGTMGRMASDSAIAWRLGDIERQLDLTSRDIKRHPGRYLAF